MRGKQFIRRCFSILCRITPADAGKTRGLRVKVLNERDHPRGCGENLPPRNEKERTPGSPPRMRGKPCGDRIINYNFRITPADAGKTPAKTQERHAREDHPRGCGENSCNACLTIAADGSPPRMRGKRNYNVFPYDEIRITPADAGKTKAASKSFSPVEDHPRGCGENPPTLMLRWMLTGSPPRMRGKPSNSLGVSTIDRITPADAGKTCTVCAGNMRK